MYTPQFHRHQVERIVLGRLVHQPVAIGGRVRRAQHPVAAQEATAQRLRGVRLPGDVQQGAQPHATAAVADGQPGAALAARLHVAAAQDEGVRVVVTLCANWNGGSILVLIIRNCS